MRLLFPDAQKLQELDYRSLAFVPYLLGDDGSYPDDANRYLRERCLLEWSAISGLTRKMVFPSIATRRGMGERLKNFLEWCEARSIRWRDVQYSEHLIYRYQPEMSAGDWSPTRRKLSRSTINQRVNEAKLFLQWAQERGLIDEFKAPVGIQDSANNTLGRFGRRNNFGIGRRPGKLDEISRPFQLPTPLQVAQWLREIKTLRGIVKALCCELIIRTGIRIEECVQWRVDTLAADPATWEIIDDSVQVRIQHGCKGRKITPDSDIGPLRWVGVPLDLAKRIHRYRELQRPAQHARWIRSARDVVERTRRRHDKMQERLFFGEKSNRPFTARMLRHAWCSVAISSSRWHPHMGRHFFAVDTVVNLTRDRLKGMSTDKIPSAEWLAGEMGNSVKLVLQPALGHVSDRTSAIYLKALRHRLIMEIGHPALKWHEFLDCEELDDGIV